MPVKFSTNLCTRLRHNATCYQRTRSLTTTPTISLLTPSLPNTIQHGQTITEEVNSQPTERLSADPIFPNPRLALLHVLERDQEPHQLFPQERGLHVSEGNRDDKESYSQHIKARYILPTLHKTTSTPSISSPTTSTASQSPESDYTSEKSSIAVKEPITASNRPLNPSQPPTASESNPNIKKHQSMKHSQPPQPL